MRQALTRLCFESKQLFIHAIGLTAPFDERELVTILLRRKAREYTLLSYETNGVTMMLQFDLHDEFFKLSQTPQHMREDLHMIALEVGIPELSRLDPIWLVNTTTDMVGYPPKSDSELEDQVEDDDEDSQSHPPEL